MSKPQLGRDLESAARNPHPTIKSSGPIPDTVGNSASQNPSDTLEDAIATATASRLRTVLLQLCQESFLCRDLASKALLLGYDANTSIFSGAASKNRKRKAYEVCENCGLEYSVEGNEGANALGEGTCVYHPGESRRWRSGEKASCPASRRHLAVDQSHAITTAELVLTSASP